MKQARLSPPWRRCSNGHEHAATVCHLCKEPVAEYVLDDPELEAALTVAAQGPEAEVPRVQLLHSSDPAREGGSRVRSG